VYTVLPNIDPSKGLILIPELPTVDKLPSEVGPQARITCGPQVVNDSPYRTHRALDFLKVSVWCDWVDSTFLDYLDAKKKTLQDTEKDVEPIKGWSDDVSWNLHRSGSRFYNFRLTSGDVTVMINRRKSDGAVPCIRIEIGSLTAQTKCFSIYKSIFAWLGSKGMLLARERVSEVHLAADFIGLDIKNLDVDNQDRWIQRSQKFSVFYNYRKLTGVTFGKGDLLLRIYDKVAELKRAGHKQEIFKDLWGVTAYDEQPVTRVEYQLRRPVLRDFNCPEHGEIKSVSDLLLALNSLWDYCTSDWAKFMKSVVNRNHNQSKAVYSEFWEAVRAVVWTGVHQFVRNQQNTHKDIDALRKQARGILMSVCAFFGMDADDIDTILEVSHALIETDLREFFHDESEFIKRMEKKKSEVLQTFDLPF
jgi:hypothetical protein